jgi:hypothetical protein
MEGSTIHKLSVQISLYSHSDRREISRTHRSLEVVQTSIEDEELARKALLRESWVIPSELLHDEIGVTVVSAITKNFLKCVAIYTFVLEEPEEEVLDHMKLENMLSYGIKVLVRILESCHQ